MKNTQDEIPSTNDMITYGNSKEPNKYSYTKITTTESGDKKVKNLDMITTTTTIIKKEETQPIKKTTGGSTSQTIKESTYYEKRGSTTARSNNTLLPTKAIARYSYSGPKLPDSFIRSGVQTTKITTTTTTSTVQRGKYGKNNKDENIPSQSYRGQKKGQKMKIYHLNLIEVKKKANHRKILKVLNISSKNQTQNIEKKHYLLTQGQFKKKQLIEENQLKIYKLLI